MTGFGVYIEEQRMVYSDRELRERHSLLGFLYNI